MTKYSLQWCQDKDANDPLQDMKSRFDIPDGIIYLDGNSLGPLPYGVKERLAKAVTREWGKDLIKSWNTADWINLPTRVGSKIAGLIGAEANEVVMADSTSVNIFKAVAAACKLNPGRTKLLSEPGNFPTDLYMMQGLTNFMAGGYKLETVDRHSIIEAITEETAVLLLTQVHYVTGHMLDMAAITKAAHDKGAIVVWDLSHSAGAVPVDLNGSNADLAVGCGYKYLNGGPGAPAFIYAAQRHHSQLEQPLTGWFGHKAPFEFKDDFEATDGIKRMLVGTTGVLAASALDAALDAWNGVDMADVREKSLALTDLFIALCEEKLEQYGVSVATTQNPAERGSHVSLSFENGYAVVQALIDRGIIGDFRAPNYMRFGFTPLYLSYIEVYNAAEQLRDILASKAWQKPMYQQKSAVT
jgi:kynureninase